MNDLHMDTEPSVKELVGGIVSDAQVLLKQQVALLRHEVREDIRKIKMAGISVMCGAGAVAFGGFLLGFMLVHLLAALAPELPLWACFGIVGAVVVLGGAALLLLGKSQFKELNPLPEQSVRALKETIQWKTNAR